MELSSEVEVFVATQKPACEVADVFRLYGDEYRQKYPVSYEQRKVMGAIEQCRTAALGGHVQVCSECEGLVISYNSCRNRHCPKCGTLAKEQWLSARRAELLPIEYFHVVFTTDHALNPLVRANQQAMYDLVFGSAAGALKELGQKYLGGEIGVVAVLHTWGQTLEEHLHLHCIVTGGALAADGSRWLSSPKGFLLPVEELSAMYRDKLCAGLRRLGRRGELELVGVCAGLEVEALVAEIQAKKWQVYAKESFGGPEQVYDYLGRYVRRIAISNYRLLSVSEGQVRFSYRDNQAGGEAKVMRLLALEFIRRFLLHVLPRGFVRVRYYGLHHNRYRRSKLARCRELLGWAAEAAQVKEIEFEEWLAEVSGQDPKRCPLCGQGWLGLGGKFERLSTATQLALRLRGVSLVGTVRC